MATVVLQNDAEYYPKTEQFIPERWIKDDPLFEQNKMNGNNSFVYLPFGFGKRSCIGRRIAEMEILIMLSRWAIDRASHCEAPIQLALHGISIDMKTIVFNFRMIREFKVEYNYGPLQYKTSIILSPNEDLKFKFTDIDR